MNLTIKLSDEDVQALKAHATATASRPSNMLWKFWSTI